MIYNIGKGIATIAVWGAAAAFVFMDPALGYVAAIAGTISTCFVWSD